MNPAQHRPTKRHPGVLANKRADRVETQTADSHPLYRNRRPVQAEREAFVALRAPCHQERDLKVPETAAHEFERLLGVGVKPLDVVDRNHKRLRRRQQTECGQSGNRDEMAVQYPVLGLVKKQSGAEGPALRAGQLIRDGAERTGEQIGQGRERQLRLGLGRACGHRPSAACRCALNPLTPEDGLADPSLSLDQQRRWARPRQEPIHSGEFAVPADNLDHQLARSGSTAGWSASSAAVTYRHLRAHETKSKL